MTRCAVAPQTTHWTAGVSPMRWKTSVLWPAGHLYSYNATGELYRPRGADFAGGGHGLMPEVRAVYSRTQKIGSQRRRDKGAQGDHGDIRRRHRCRGRLARILR